MEKTTEELRAAIEADKVDNTPAEDTGTQEAQLESKEAGASDEEGTPKVATADNPPVETTEEEWVVPGRFKTQADVLKAYGELESMAGRQSSEIHKLRTAIVEPARRGESNDEKTARLKRFADELTVDPEEAIAKRVRNIVGEVKGEIKASEIKASEFQRAYEARKSDSNSDFAELEPTMTALAQQFGDMIIQNGMQNDPRLLDILHLAARGLKSPELANKARTDGVKKGEEKARQKSKARVEGSSGTQKTRKIDPDKMTAAQLRAAIEKGDLE